MIVPSIDLLEGRVVQLQQGKEVKISVEEKPLAFAKRFSSFVETQVIDLNAAIGTGNNFETVKKICQIVNARVGGGIRSTEKARQLFEAGARKIIVGTMAKEGFLLELCKEFGKERIIVALDSKNGKVAVKGWQETAEETPVERAKRLEGLCSEFLYTCIEKEGLMKGVDWQTIKNLKRVSKNKLSIAGGISSIKEVKKLEKMGIKSVVGMAIYTGKIKLRELK